jgi:hypothetical protein
MSQMPFGSVGEFLRHGAEIDGGAELVLGAAGPGAVAFGLGQIRPG